MITSESKNEMEVMGLTDWAALCNKLAERLVLQEEQCATARQFDLLEPYRSEDLLRILAKEKLSRDWLPLRSLRPFLNSESQFHTLPIFAGLWRPLRHSDVCSLPVQEPGGTLAD